MAIVTKTYIKKTNTIIRDSCSNTGLNPILELNYGKDLTRGLIYFDHNKVKKLVEDKIYPDINKLKHTLKLVNVASLTPDYKLNHCVNNFDNNVKERAVSFDLIFFLINKEWDDGVGFDYIKDLYKGNNRYYSENASNWFKAKNFSNWDEEGIYSTERLSREFDTFKSMNGKVTKRIIGYQHFERGNENIEFDITKIFNQFITGDLENYGIGIAFSPRCEETTTNHTQYVGFLLDIRIVSSNHMLKQYIMTPLKTIEQTFIWIRKISSIFTPISKEIELTLTIPRYVP